MDGLRQSFAFPVVGYAGWKTYTFYSLILHHNEHCAAIINMI